MTRTASPVLDTFLRRSVDSRRGLEVSRDGAQTYLYAADGENKGNLYTTEVDNAKRVHEFVYPELLPPTE